MSPTPSLPGTSTSLIDFVDSGSTDGTPEIGKWLSSAALRIAPETFHHARTGTNLASLAQGRTLYTLRDAFGFPNWLNPCSPISRFLFAQSTGSSTAQADCNLERQVVLARCTDEKVVKDRVEEEWVSLLPPFYRQRCIRRNLESTGVPEN